ncbi:PREDICTED: uncharacterized protein LOC104608816 [Nelumbo nucifera]|uniref:Uncharacterized protein LOC104608816 n=1 Tax=Nelumbo nucifera TaxID=4432 RepID=A0A1U8AYF7_NELNU|nr:PREDICTED: uncharacterized protein LOC104608816 [Nelumbo nucifera]XP_010273199.1 PREDICTED: uncharacterized protein LOC104608816 [Nelumbo nucifera]XP_010273201.1 PREDICTED: uncharacterized protein LOC104608816 [Nelumbo nucifera]XP_010273202.1 PREDICTED: uncharacterized protein LOC104608816 [Nelumbo nucifera]
MTIKVKSLVMASTRAQRQLILQDENLGIFHKGPAVDGRNISSKVTIKKGKGGFGNRKALGDITNISCPQKETSSKKKNHPKVEFNIAEEAFLHDHRKCTEKQEAAMDHYFLDAFLLDHDLISPAISMKPKQAETMLKSPPWLLELELEPELPVPALPVWLDSPIQWNTPSSPLHFEPVEFRLKPDDDISIGS